MANQIEFRHLEYFLVLSETLHYGRAADRLYISQSALSQQIQRLEQLLGQHLFDRTNRRVELNHAGKLFKKAALEITGKLHEALDHWNLELEEMEGIIRIGFVGSAMQEFLPKIIKKFSKNFPNTRFSLDEMNNKSQLEALEAQQLDIGFMRSNEVPQHLSCRQVYSENLCLVVPENHWAAEHEQVDISALADERFILFPNQQSQMYYQQIIRLCKHYGFAPKISHRSIHGPTIFKLVESGMGISFIPSSLKDNGTYKVKCIELDHVPFTTALFAVWSKENAKDGLQRFLELLLSEKTIRQNN